MNVNLRLAAGEGVYATVEQPARMLQALDNWSWRLAQLDEHTVLIRTQHGEQRPDALLALLLKIFGVTSELDAEVLQLPVTTS